MKTEEEKKKAAEDLATAIADAHAALGRAKAIADENGLEFYFAPEYGMGGSYYGANHPDKPEDLNEDQGGWLSSSHNC